MKMSKKDFDKMSADDLKPYYDKAEEILDNLIEPDNFENASEDQEILDETVRSLIDFENSILDREGIL